MNFDEQKKEVLQEKVQIENEMISMAQGMKEFANNFKTQFQRDQSVIEQIGQKQDVNLVKTKQELDKINKTDAGLVPDLCKKIFMLCIALATFVFMIMFIRLFPHKRYIMR